jgi:hypothetical protein
LHRRPASEEFRLIAEALRSIPSSDAAYNRGCILQTLIRTEALACLIRRSRHLPILDAFVNRGFSALKRWPRRRGLRSGSCSNPTMRSGTIRPPHFISQPGDASCLAALTLNADYADGWSNRGV